MFETENTSVAPYLKQFKMCVNPDEKRVSVVVNKLLHNTMQFGVPYCPCQAEHTPDTICPCRYMRNAGACRCGFFVKKGLYDGE